MPWTRPCGLLWKGHLYEIEGNWLHMSTINDHYKFGIFESNSKNYYKDVLGKVLAFEKEVQKTCIRKLKLKNL